MNKLIKEGPGLYRVDWPDGRCAGYVTREKLGRAGSGVRRTGNYLWWWGPCVGAKNYPFDSFREAQAAALRAEGRTI